MDLDDQAVGEDGDRAEQLVEQGAAFVLGGGLPDLSDVDPVEQGDEFLEPCGDVLGVELLGGVGCRICFEVVDLDGEPCLFVAELVGADVAGVVQVQELVALVT